LEVLELRGASTDANPHRDRRLAALAIHGFLIIAANCGMQNKTSLQSESESEAKSHPMCLLQKQEEHQSDGDHLLIKSKRKCYVTQRFATQ
jgi:hypothetical protein